MPDFCLGKSSTCAKPEFHTILGVGLGLIRKPTATKPRIFPSAQHTLGKRTCAKPEFRKIPGVGQGFIRKLTTTKPRVFPIAEHTHLEKPREQKKTVFARNPQNPRGWPRINLKADYYKT